MNSGIITSFVIGGLLLLAILSMNINISRSSTGLAMRQVTQQHQKAVANLLTYDLPKMGYDQFSKISPAISLADSNRLVFRSNIDTTNGSIETVTWFYDYSTPVSSTSFPDDYQLTRDVSGEQTKLNLGITKFRFTYLDANQDTLTVPVSNPGQIRHIIVEFTAASKEKLGKIGSGEGDYIRSPWQKNYSPKNLY